MKNRYQWVKTHWGRVTHICVSKININASDNGLSPGRRQAIIWTNADLLSIGRLETIFSETLIQSRSFSFKKMHLKMSSVKSHLFCLGLNVLIKSIGIYGKWPHTVCLNYRMQTLGIYSSHPAAMYEQGTVSINNGCWTIISLLNMPDI